MSDPTAATGRLRLLDLLGRWLHVEQMDTGTWWMDVGGVTVWVRADRDGRPTAVTVYGPGDYADPVPGVTYGGPALGEWLDRQKTTRKDEG